MLRHVTIRTALCLGLFALGIVPARGEEAAKKVFVEAPDFCHTVERVDGDKVYLVPPDKPCDFNLQGKLEATVASGIDTVRIFVSGKPWKEQRVSWDFDTEAVVARAEATLADSNTMPRIANINEAQAKQLAEALRIRVDSPDFQKRLNAEIDRLVSLYIPKELKDYYTDSKDPRIIGMNLPDNERIYLFISSSMPTPLLRRYIRDIDKIGDDNIKVMLNGMIGGMTYIRPTLQFTAAITVKDPSCDLTTTPCPTYRPPVLIDSLVFRRFAINKVPAFVYSRNTRPIDPALSEGFEHNLKEADRDYLIVTGDVSLLEALERFYEKAPSPQLKGMIDRLKEGFYSEATEGT